jgi:hypothetical protein
MKMIESDTRDTHSMSLTLGLCAALSTAACVACDVRDFLPIPKVALVQPKDEALVTSPVYFEMEAKHWVIEPPTERHDGAGYFVIVLEGGCVEPGRLVPFEGPYVHVADGGFVAWVDLAPGKYDVCLQVADGNHRATQLVHEVSFEVVEN